MNTQPTSHQILELISNEFEDRSSSEEVLKNIRILINERRRKNREASRTEGPPPKMPKQSEEQVFGIVMEEESPRREGSSDVDSDEYGIEIDEIEDREESIEPFEVLTYCEESLQEFGKK